MTDSEKLQTLKRNRLDCRPDAFAFCVEWQSGEYELAEDLKEKGILKYVRSGILTRSNGNATEKYNYNLYRIK